MTDTVSQVGFWIVFVYPVCLTPHCSSEKEKTKA